MRGSVRRGFAAVGVVAALVVAVPGSGQASTGCGVAVCAEANAVAAWTCTTTDNISPGYDLIECSGRATPSGRGYSQLSVPGSLTWSGTTEYGYSFDGGMTWNRYPGPSTSASTCTWAGLGEDTCGGTGTAATQGVGGPIPWGACINTYYGWDLEVSATVTATATKSVPVLGPIDSGTTTETAAAKLSQVPQSERCAFQ